MRYDLGNKKILEIEGLEIGSQEVVVYFESGEILRFYHEQDCCETVELVDIDCMFDIHDTAIKAYELEIATEHQMSGGGDLQWTFYFLRTSRGTLWMRWYGSSNGYYSTAVEIDGLYNFSTLS